MKKIAPLLVLLAILFLNISAQTEERRIERLSGLAKVWGAVKYFHPYLAYREIDWDKALIQTIPKVDAARTREEYAAAINLMLAHLGDKQTTARIVNVEKPIIRNPSSGKDEYPVRLENGILFYDALGASRITVNSWRRLDEFKSALVKLLPQAKAILVDARGVDESDDAVLAEIRYEMTAIMPEILDGDITTGTIRYRLHNGYVPQDGQNSGGYYSSFVTDAPEPLAGHRATGTLPTVVLVDASNRIGSLLGGLQSAGKAFVIAEGESAAGGDFYTMDLGDSVRVAIRTTEIVNPDGTVGFAPDLSTAPGEAGKAARDLIALNRFISTRTKTSAVQVTLVTQKDKTYPGMEFPDKEYRLMALFRFWNIINYFYPYKDLIGTEWNTILPKYIGQFEADKDASAYRVTGQKMVAEIHDSHGIFLAPPLKTPKELYYPPFIEDHTDGAWFVRVILDDKAGFKVGDVILEVDDAPVDTLMSEYAARISASTPQALMRDLKYRAVFRGVKDSKIRFKVRGLDGTVRQIDTMRSVSARDDRFGNYFQTMNKRKTETVSVLPSGFAYVDLDRLPVSNAEVDQIFETIKNAPAAIFDMRGYPRGDLHRMVSHLSDRPVPPGVFSRPFRDGKTLGDPTLVGPPTFGFLNNDDAREPYKGPLYKGRIVMLINETTQSAAEGTATVFAGARPDITFIGTPTAGANGDVSYGILPGNIKFAFTGHNVRGIGGRQLQRVGIQPTIRVDPTIRGILAGRDEILEAAITFLRSAGDK